MKRHQNNSTGKISEPLRVLNPKFRELRSLIESLRLRAQLLDLQAAVLVGAYVIFQGVMYGQQVNPSSAAWRQSMWFPTCLSASASLAFWPVFINTVNDCMRTRRQHESSYMEQDKVYWKINSAHGSRPDAAAASQRSLDRAFAAVRRQRHAYVWALYFALLLFTLSVPFVYLSLPASKGIRRPRLPSIQNREFHRRVVYYYL